jgi:hypothetical protein
MATSPTPLYHGQPTNSATTLYTVPSATVTVIRHIRAVNDDSVSHTLDLYRNGSASANRITETITIQAGSSYEDDVYIPLATADTIQGKADASSKVTLFIGGAEIT